MEADGLEGDFRWRGFHEKACEARAIRSTYGSSVQEGERDAS